MRNLRRKHFPYKLKQFVPDVLLLKTKPELSPARVTPPDKKATKAKDAPEIKSQVVRVLLKMASDCPKI